MPERHLVPIRGIVWTQHDRIGSDYVGYCQFLGNAPVLQTSESGVSICSQWHDFSGRSGLARHCMESSILFLKSHHVSMILFSVIRSSFPSLNQRSDMIKALTNKNPYLLTLLVGEAGCWDLGDLSDELRES